MNWTAFNSESKALLGLQLKTSLVHTALNNSGQGAQSSNRSTEMKRFIRISILCIDQSCRINLKIDTDSSMVILCSEWLSTVNV